MSEVAEALKRFFNEATYPVIFIGAGVSVRAGLPTWKQLVTSMAEGLRQSDPLTTQQMLECVREGEYTLAVDYFNISRKMLEGEKRKLIRQQLKTFNIDTIRPIARLPFRACLTTNFDRSMLEVIAAERHLSALDFKYGDMSFRQAQWEEDLFVARIHGAAEVAESIILSESQFKVLLEDDSYKDLLRACFVNRNVLFVGFSFYDPAVRHIFEDLDRRFGAASPGRHMALLPQDISSEFLQKAARLNIEVIKYDSENYHSALWASIEEFNGFSTVVEELPFESVRTPFESTKRYLAACYARAKTQDSSMALREAVLEGIVSALLQEAAPAAISRADILEKIRLALGLKGRDAENILNKATVSLIDEGLCVKIRGTKEKGAKYSWRGGEIGGSSLDSAINTLSESIASRAFLEEGWKIDSIIKDKVVIVFNHLIKRRGWDLGASFASGRPPEIIAIDSVFNECSLSLAAYDRERLLRVFTNMLIHPSADESQLLGELGRISFAMEMAFHSPQKTLLHNAVLPRSIYFDANVLLPALVVGHPFNQVYQEVISRLKSASQSAALKLDLNVCQVYLNEIISHRKNALAYCEEAGDEFAKIARSDALYNGVTNLNVFVGAYANWVENNEEISFKDFLLRFAPYNTEGQLRTWLIAKGFKITNSYKNSKYPEYYSSLEKAYAGSLTNGKTPILMEHDAIQLSILDSDISKGEKTLFVTGDRRLQQIALGFKNSSISEMMISHVGLVQLIELVLGGISEGAGFTELLWSARISNKAQAVRSHLVALGLAEYNDSIALSMPAMIESFSAVAAKELERTDSDLDSSDPKLRVKAFKTLGGLEENYLKNMHLAVDRLQKRELA
ncbi:hypothetical protein ASE80_01570 [Pseudomonas sp. Leaf15]|uniref:SIR2 family protein n=1 Tax=unclassified Pseudomonas TaxID=196821 RepID=UPI0007039612|nr:MULTISPECIES: SIR2 family protein [unclassified Pseudomonas]KQM55770.1 hypothetical protein ASE80_01570 [Pseudomonas sp. Leaf15]RAH03853.1 hypothetical protein DJ480_05240 [Pseudomonas sp. Leaf98]